MFTYSGVKHLIDPFTTMINKRRAPAQSRSKEMVNTILMSAKRLIGQQGYDAVSMREIAREAGISPAAIYQYFDDKNAILAELVSRYYEMTFQMTTALLERTTGLDDVEQLLRDAVGFIHAYFSQDADLLGVWSAVMASHAINGMDVQHCVATAQAITNRLLLVQPGLNREQVQTSSLLMVRMLTATVHLALSMRPQEAQSVLDEFVVVFASRIRQLAVSPDPYNRAPS